MPGLAGPLAGGDGAFSGAWLRTGLFLESLSNPTWEGADARILIARLSPFADVEGSTPHKILFEECRRVRPGAFIDMAFLPSRGDRAILAKAGAPLYYGIASLRPVSDFDLVLVSNAFTLELANLPLILSGTGLAQRYSERRRAGAERPLVILGGSNSGATGSIRDEKGDSLVDGIFFGEAEASGGDDPVSRLLAALCPPTAAPAVARLRAAGEALPSFLPSGREGGARLRVVRPGEPAGPFSGAPSLGLLPRLNGPGAERARLEIAKGCPASCSFCFEGWERKPYRETALGEILTRGRLVKALSGAMDVEIQAFNFNAHARIAELLLGLETRFDRVSAMSQRVDMLAADPLILDLEFAQGKRSFTLGIEGISKRARAYYHKSLPDEALEIALARLEKIHAREIKLFFILSGLERAEDAEEFSRLASRLALLRDKAPSPPRVVFSFGYLVRLPGTPLQFETLVLEEDAFDGILRSCAKAIEERGMEWRTASGFEEYCVNQVLALGGGGLMDFIVQASEEGAIYDQGLPKGYWKAMRAFALERGILSVSFLGKKELDYPFPLEGLERPVAKKELYKRFQAAKRCDDGGYCLGSVCSACGACLNACEKALLLSHESPPCPAVAPRRMASLVAAKRKTPPFTFIVDLPEALYGCRERAASAWLLSRLYSAFPALLDFPLSAEEALFHGGALAGALPTFYGRTLFRIRGLPGAGLGTESPGWIRPAPAGFAAPELWSLRVQCPSRSLIEARRAVDAVFASERVAATLAKREGAYEWLVGPKEAKRRSILSARAFAEGDITTIVFSLGRKAGLSALPRAFGLHPMGLRMEAAFDTIDR